MSEREDRHYFTEQAQRDWQRIGERHRLRDQQFLRKLQTWFRPGSILELGAATGHISEILHRSGHDVMASDVSPRFVEACAARGLKAMIVDATADIQAQTGRCFDNVLAQNVMPLIRRDRETLLLTLSAIHRVLEPDGRLITISAHAYRAPNPGNYFSPGEQLAIVRASGFFHVVATFPHQVVPTALYRRWNAAFLNFLDFNAARIASIRHVSIMQKAR